MKHGYLSQYFDGVCVKRLSAVEADVLRSNQHEFDGVKDLRQILGDCGEPVKYPARFLYFADHDDEPVVDDGFLTWYDARMKARIERGVMRKECRLYFTTNSVLQCAVEGDLLVIAKQPGDTLLAVVAEQGSTIERQLLWLFGFGELTHPGFSVKSELENDQDRIGFAARVVLESIGIEVEESAPNFLDEMLQLFGGTFPSSAVFSTYARSTLKDLDGRDDPDIALTAWMDREEVLFRTLERHLLGDALQGLGARDAMDPDAYMALTMSFLQRRKSRAGSALENHVEQIFNDNQVTYSRGRATEVRLKPDFILPGIAHYHDAAFAPARLTMLASKTTCKDRWRQILNEAQRIPAKHLLTLEPGISEGQTSEMQAERVQLVLPVPLHPTYTDAQRAWMMSVAQFVTLAQQRQR